MEEPYQTIPLPNFKFSDLIQRKAATFYLRKIGVQIISVKKVSDEIDSELYTLNNKADKIQFSSYKYVSRIS